MTRHTLKTWAAEFEAVRLGLKTHEVRPDDRDFAVGDVLDLVEVDANTLAPTGREASYYVSYLSRGRLPRGPLLELAGTIGSSAHSYTGPVCVMSIRPVDRMGWPK